MHIHKQPPSLRITILILNWTAREQHSPVGAILVIALGEVANAGGEYKIRPY